MNATLNDSLAKPSRRAFVKGGLAGGFLLAFHVPVFGGVNEPNQPPDDTSGKFAPNAFIRIDKAGKTTLVMPQVEMGQGVYTSVAMILAEELDADYSQVTLEHAPPNEKLYANPLFGGMQATGSSNSIRAFWKPLRTAGASARAMLVQAAAKQWKVDPSSCTTSDGKVTHGASNRTLSYGALADAASRETPPKDTPLKDPKDFRLIGKPQKRFDTPSKVDGSAVYGIDAMLPGMKFATIAASPVFGGKVSKVDDRAAKQIPGVQQVVVLDDMVAVVGDHFWAAKSGLDALQITWDDGPHAALSNDAIWKHLREQSAKDGVVAKSAGDVNKAFESGERFHAAYELPFLAHATMEPMNCLVQLKSDGGCEIWLGTQVISRVQQTAAKLLGVSDDKVVVHNHLIGGGFGRRLEPDMALKAVRVAQHLNGEPVKVVWSREEDMKQDIYRPVYRDEISATVNDGKISGWKYKVCGSSILARFLPPAFQKGIDIDAIDGAVDQPYDFPNIEVQYVRVEPPAVPTGFWRGVGPNNNVFALECFIDEVANKLNKDPIAFRTSMLDKGPRFKAVLDLVAQKSGWGQPLGKRVGRGVCLVPAFGSFIAAVIEAEVDEHGEVLLRKITSAVDTGIVVNPDTVVAQLQGGIIFGLTAALYGEVTIEGGRVQQSNFHNYRMLRIDQIPSIDVHLVQSGEAPGGIGETGTIAAPPALRNAIYAATGIPLRRLPIDRDVLAGRKAAMGMRRRSRVLRGLLIVVLVGLVAGTGLAIYLRGPGPTDFAGGQKIALTDYKDASPTSVPPSMKSADPIQRGKYLTDAADCLVCHTARGSQEYAGGFAFTLPFGTIYSTNITPDKETGIGNYTDQEFLAAMHRGVRKDGARLYPAMPFASYTYITDEDALAIKAYLFSLAPVRAPARANTLTFPFNQRWAIGMWSMVFNPDQRFQPDTSKSAEWNRGAYLSEALAHCGECHTPRNVGFALNNRKKFAGENAGGWLAYNISADKGSGIGQWSDDDVAAYIGHGHANNHGSASGPMGEAVAESLSRLAPEDIKAIVAYVRSVPATSSNLPAQLALAAPDSHKQGSVANAHGKQVFEGACMSCHNWSGIADISPYATLTGSRAINDPSGTNVAQIVISGSTLASLGGSPNMPAFGDTYSNQEIADVTNYVTARFGSKGSTLSEMDVAKLRRQSAQ